MVTVDTQIHARTEASFFSLRREQSFGLSEVLLKWFNLHDRVYFILIASRTREQHAGSHKARRSALLLNLYILQLAGIIQIGITYQMYADDTQMYIAVCVQHAPWDGALN